ncbi:MAG: choice-of-anchor D domain-containing protein [Planctomycetota bacterium]|nr:MAG: choice-of-anchor D domain-containing protein [Planctomycetota bacterium]REK46608.1 MAG: choice-of-anchor D domain-containing protein [Planctomycetota bacterium]
MRQDAMQQKVRRFAESLRSPRRRRARERALRQSSMRFEPLEERALLAVDTLFAVNAGGPEVVAADSTVWQADPSSAPSAFLNQAASGNATYGTGDTIDTSLVPAEIPTSIFSTERFSAGGAPLQWDFPVTPGEVEVRLFFAEIYGGTQSVGARQFDITIENELVLDDYDVFADVGANTAVMKSFVVSTDANLDIDLSAVVENPAIKGIEILQVVEDGILGASTTNLDFGSLVAGDFASQAITLTNQGGVGDSDITVSSATVTGSVDFTSDFPVVGVTLAPGESTTINVTYTPSDIGTDAANFEIAHNGTNTPIIVALAGEGTDEPGVLVARINTGGPAIGDPSWDADTGASPSPFSNFGTSGSQTFVTGTPINVSDASIPDGTPAAIFSSERWDPSSGTEMEWDFAVAPGEYEVILYFSEIYSGALAVGARVFDVLIEGNLVLDDYDVFADVGGFAGVAKSFNVTSDANLDIDFGHVVENPALKGIEILRTVENSTIGSSTTSLDFSEVIVGDPATQEIVLTNLGNLGDSDIVVSSGTITGSPTFTSDFPVAGVNLAPGESTTVTVTYTPTAVGSDAASIEFIHSGVNSPITVTLAGEGIENPGLSTVRINAGGDELGDPIWSADSPASPSPFSNFATAGTSVLFDGTPVDVGDASIPAGTPAAIFNSQRFDLFGGEEMEWDIPVTPGNYEVLLYFAEIFTGNQAVGARVFDVYIEDSLVLDDYDIFADVGAFAGVAKSFEVSVDDNLDIDFGALTSDPSIAGIEVVRMVEDETLSSSTTSLDFGDTAVGSPVTLPLFLTHQGDIGDPSITVTSATIGGSGVFADDFPVGGVTLAPGEFTTINVTYTPVTKLGDAATLLIEHTGVNSPITVNLAGSGAGTTLYQINTGGPAVGTPSWDSDTDASPSPFSNFAAAPTQTFADATPIDVSHPSIPAGTPAEIFSTERYDPFGGEEMQWDFPVQPGPHEVRLYFAEIFPGAAVVGGRLIDVFIEDTLVLDDFDAFAEAGAFAGIAKSFIVNSDANLDIDFIHEFENPAIKGIEVISLLQAENLVADFTSYDFGPTFTGLPASMIFTVSNAGAAGDPSITVNSTDIVGSTEFSDDFDDLSSVVLAPGESTQIEVTFAPSVVTEQTATLEIFHSGTNTPLTIELVGTGSNVAPVGFGKSTLVGTATTANPTTLQWGPDNRLYVGHQDGTIHVYSVTRNAANDYAATLDETITLVKTIPNHNDDGQLNPFLNSRLVTGLLVAGTPQNPILYVTSSDPRIGAGPEGEDLNLDTNSGILSQLTWNGAAWDKVDLVRGLPRSEENHTANGMTLDPVNNVMYVTQGGNTNAGAPSNNFALLPEYAYSAAILSVDLTQLGQLPTMTDINGQDYKYDLPTLDDEDRDFDGSGSDVNLAGGIQDVFGGNDGKNQAVLDPTGPVQIYAPGFRNPYDVVLTDLGLYTVDNGANAGWGDIPILDGTSGLATNDVNEPGATVLDNLQYIPAQGYYGGHPNPTRANTDNTFNASNPQSPVAAVGGNALESFFTVPQSTPGALAVFGASTNGLVEYKASNFGGGMQGDLLAATFFGGNSVERLSPDATGAALDLNETLFSNIGVAPLDVTAVDDAGLFPGSIWVVDWFLGDVIVFEPNDFDGAGGGPVDPNDTDGDGYTNDDEIANGTNPNSSADVPPDNDGDFVSDLLDDNDDNDTLLDVDDPFAIDATNGNATTLDVFYGWENDGPNLGGILNLGFTGLMINGTDNYKDLFDTNALTAGGAAGVLTLDEVSEGTAQGATNTQQQAFQFGVNVSEEITPFTAYTRVISPFAGVTPAGDQSLGLFIGNGDQDNYIEIVVTANAGPGGVAVNSEVAGTFVPGAVDAVSLPGPSAIDLFLTVDPLNLTVQPSYEVTQSGATGPRTELGSPIAIPAAWLNGATALAVGIISTSGGPALEFPGQWDFVSVFSGIPNLEVLANTSAVYTAEVGQSVTQPVVVTHSGPPSSAPIQLTSIEFSGSEAADFSDDFNDVAGLLLQPGDSTVVNVTFTPSATGEAAAFLEVHSDMGYGPARVPLTGFGNPASSSSSSFFQVDTGVSPAGSTFVSGSIVVENTSTGGQQIEKVTINLSSAILPDIVFDPNGTAGDQTPKGFTPDSSTILVGVTAAAFEGERDGGFDALTIEFNDFDPGESFSFSTDIDPTSIKGIPAPGPNDSGSLNGLELTGSNVVVSFSDGSQQASPLFATPTSVGISQNSQRTDSTTAPVVELLGVPYSPTGFLAEVEQVARVSGPVGADVVLLQTESGLYLDGVPGGGFDIDPFETNTVIASTQFAATIGATGFVDIPITLFNSEPEAGLNTLVAVVKEADGHTSRHSPPLRVQVASASDLPFVVNPLGASTFVQDAPDATFDLTTVFSDLVDGSDLTYSIESNSNPTLVGASLFDATLTVDFLPGQTGSAAIVVRATDSDGLFVEDTLTVNVTPVTTPSSIALENGLVANVSSTGWTTVNLANTYTSMVVVATPNYDENSPPLITRVQNATGSSFEVMVQRADGLTDATAADVYFFVVEEGVYTLGTDGVKMEAVKYNSTVTDYKGNLFFNWLGNYEGEEQSYSNNYTSPVVLGQVMTYNNTEFTAFWAAGSSRFEGPTSTTLTTGKFVGEDPNIVRADETIGYVVFEAGSGSIGNLEFTADVGPQVVQGVTQEPASNYSLTGPANPTAAVLSQAGMWGPDGSWAILNGDDPFDSTSIKVSVDEDTLNDAERNHTQEEVAFVMFGFSPLAPAPATSGGSGLGPAASFDPAAEPELNSLQFVSLSAGGLTETSAGLVPSPATPNAGVSPQAAGLIDEAFEEIGEEEDDPTSSDGTTGDALGAILEDLGL